MQATEALRITPDDLLRFGVVSPPAAQHSLAGICSVMPCRGRCTAACCIAGEHSSHLHVWRWHACTPAVRYAVLHGACTDVPACRPPAASSVQLHLSPYFPLLQMDENIPSRWALNTTPNLTPSQCLLKSTQLLIQLPADGREDP